ELRVAAPVVAVGGAHETEGPLLDEIEELDGGGAVALGDGDDEPEIRLDEPPARVRVAGLDALRELHFLRAREERVAADLVQVKPKRILGGCGLGFCCGHRIHLSAVDGRCAVEATTRRLWSLRRDHLTLATRPSARGAPAPGPSRGRHTDDGR